MYIRTEEGISTWIIYSLVLRFMSIKQAFVLIVVIKFPPWSACEIINHKFCRESLRFLTVRVAQAFSS